MLGVRRARALCAATAAVAGAPTAAVEFAEIADQLLEKRQLPAGRRGRSSDRSDLLSVVENLVVDGFDDALVVKPDDIDLLVENGGFEESGLGSPPAYVIPRFVIVEDADARRRPEYLDDFVLGCAPGVDLRQLLGGGQISALLDRRSAARQCRYAGEEDEEMADGNPFMAEHGIALPVLC